MHVNDFNFDLPPGLIAKYPLPERDGCRLLYMNRRNCADGGSSTQPFQHLSFRDILTILQKGDRLVFNDTRVIPARVFCKKEGIGGAAVELLFTEQAGVNQWKALVKPAKRLPVGGVASVDGCPSIKIRVDGIAEGGYERIITLISGANDLYEVIDAHGHIPLPHYMERDDEDIDRELYQTVYGNHPGAVAAPTAGLHFTDKLLDEISAMGVDKSFVTLHVGIGTFRPVKVDDPRQHDIHEERFELTEQTAHEINETWRRGGRVIAVGTTVVRTLESCAVSKHRVAPNSSKTKLMILPPYDFKAVDGLITNFHLPKSTLLMLTAAFTSTESILKAYREAIKEKYRFYSYGDAMIII
jgi:S-adenosylmethionine:tRNA ribosyltransferase-isomerase